MARAALIAAVYAVVGGLWIVATDLLFANGTAAADAGRNLSKGLGFVAVTAVALAVALCIMNRRERRLARSLAAASGETASERARTESGQRLFGAVAESIRDLVWIFDAEHRVVRANAAARAALGMGDNPAEPMTLAEAGWPEEHRAAIGELIDTVLATGESRHGRAVYRLGGRDRAYEYSIQPITDATTRATHALAVGHDVTAIVAAEAALARRNRTLQAIVAGLTAISHVRDRQKLAEAVTAALHGDDAFDVAWIAMRCERGDLPLVPIAASGVGLETIRDRLVRIAGGGVIDTPALSVLRTGRPVVSADLRTEPYAEAIRDVLDESGARTSIALPLVFSGRVFGLLNLYTLTVTEISDEEVAQLAAFAEDLARAFATLDSLVRYEESEAGRLAALDRSKEILLETIEALASVVEVRDPYTAGHQRRVAALATAIARRKGWPTERIEGLRLGALVHDIGKIGVPTELLVKPGRLSQAEFALIKTHTTRGVEILKGIRFDWPILEMVLQHHERLDGSGYPAGIRDNEISPEAKVLAVADVAEAMLSHRPYRPALEFEDVRAELMSGRGSRYETSSVDICLALLRAQGTAVFDEIGIGRQAAE
jgi:PAS domain S-box-containing protein/putative nucleotidyltransferase with HDIG domain